MDLTLYLIDNTASVNDVCIGTIQTEQIWEARYRSAFVRISSISPTRLTIPDRQDPKPASDSKGGWTQNP